MRKFTLSTIERHFADSNISPTTKLLLSDKCRCRTNVQIGDICPNRVSSRFHNRPYRRMWSHDPIAHAAADACRLYQYDVVHECTAVRAWMGTRVQVIVSMDRLQVHLSIYLSREAGPNGPLEDSIYILCLPLNWGCPTGERQSNEWKRGSRWKKL